MKAKMVVCGVETVENPNSHLSKPELGSRCLAHVCNNRIGDLLYVLPFWKKAIVVYSINQKYAVFYSGKVRF